MKFFKKLKHSFQSFKQRLKERREKRRVKVKQGVKKIKVFTGKKSTKIFTAVISCLLVLTFCLSMTSYLTRIDTSGSKPYENPVNTLDLKYNLAEVQTYINEIHTAQDLKSYIDNGNLEVIEYALRHGVDIQITEKWTYLSTERDVVFRVVDTRMSYDESGNAHESIVLQMRDCWADLVVYDAAESYSDNSNIQQSGDCRYSISNIRQFLNANTHVGWFIPSSSTDVLSPSYSYGFKCGFNNEFLSCIKKSKIVSNYRIENVFDITYDFFFLPSVDEIGCNFNFSEGICFRYYSGINSPSSHVKRFGSTSSFLRSISLGNKAVTLTSNGTVSEQYCNIYLSFKACCTIW